MSIGYETQVPPINILTFYNGIANNGVTVRPKFVRAAVKDGEIVQEYPTEVINPKICSDKTLAQIREILRKVVGEGLGQACGKQASSRLRKDRNGTDFTGSSRIQDRKNELSCQFLRVFPVGSA